MALRSWNFLVQVLYLCSKISQSEHCIYCRWHSDWMFFECEYKTHTQFYDSETWFELDLEYSEMSVWNNIPSCISISISLSDRLFITYFPHLEKRHPYWLGPIWKWSCSNPITSYWNMNSLLLVILVIQKCLYSN